MKRIIPVVLAFCLIFGTFAYAEEIDLASLSTEELLQLRTDLTDELFNRDEGVLLVEGKYVVGKDIAPGAYTVVECEDDTWSRLTVYLTESSEFDMQKAENAYLKASNAHSDPENTTVVEEPESVDYTQYYRRSDLYDRCECRITLEEGNVLDVSVVRQGKSTNPLIIFKGPTGLFMD